MTSSVSLTRSVLAATIGAALMFGAVSSASAQSSAMERSNQAQRDRQKQEDQDNQQAEGAQNYPQATRTPSGESKASARMSRKLQDMLDLYDADKSAEARAIADEVIADEDANAYSKSFAAQLAGQIAYDADDTPAASQYLQQTLQFNGLDNNAHYATMKMLAQLQLQEQQYDQALATIDRFLQETGSQDSNDLVIKGNALYRLKRYPEAAATLEQAIEASSAPQPAWIQMLMATYFESGQKDKAAELASQLGAANPNDKGAQLNLAAVYQQSGQYAKASAVLEKLRAAGKLTEGQEYRVLYSTYLNQEGKEQQAIDVINEGIDKGVLKPDYQTWLALGQSYYFSGQAEPAIEAYTKAAPLADDGEIYLNLAKILWQEGRIEEAKQAAKQALAKGLDSAKEANRILALPGG